MAKAFPTAYGFEKTRLEVVVDRRCLLLTPMIAGPGPHGPPSTMSVHHVPFTRREVTDNAVVTFGASDKGFSLGHGEGISVAFSVASPQNAVRGSVRARG